MFMETPQTLIILTGGAFFLGWLVGKIGAYFGNKFAAKNRDPRDDRIRSLDAELRIARGETEKSKAESEETAKELKFLKTAHAALEEKLKKEVNATLAVRKDLRDSVKKTRELRYELSDRAAENLKSEVKLREVETELSVAQASTDLLATGVLDYSMTPDEDDDEEDAVQIIKSGF